MVKFQRIFAFFSLHDTSQATIPVIKIHSLGIRRDKHCLDNMLSSISAIFNQDVNAHAGRTNKYTLIEGVFVCWMYLDCRKSKLFAKLLVKGLTHLRTLGFSLRASALMPIG